MIDDSSYFKDYYLFDLFSIMINEGESIFDISLEYLFVYFRFVFNKNRGSFFEDFDNVDDDFSEYSIFVFGVGVLVVLE